MYTEFNAAGNARMVNLTNNDKEMRKKTLSVPKILPFVRTLLEESLSEGDTAMDATAGNGHDTLFLREVVGHTGYVLSFDIQKEALQHTKKTPGQADSQCTDPGQSCQCNDLSKWTQPKAAIFNLGYLPGGDKTIVTSPSSTITSVRQLLSVMPRGAVIIIVVYYGHEEGKKERDALVKFTCSLSHHEALVARYEFINHTNDPPFILAIEKRKGAENDA
ncbi:LOW QUALITY PROTEIN: SAM-dependent methyltransferase, MraW methylase family [Geomicrobium sp. JCM 19037]|nr:LOW QUALITY PROTEIN: SAM-dependent methyltransferase, MraW methylase family [Geomicrobium sp. JCM 19037]